MDKHISAIVKSFFLQRRDLHRIRPLISKTAAMTLVNAFVHSHLDYCNSLFYGLPKYSIHSLKKYKTQLLVQLRVFLVLLTLRQFLNLYNNYQYYIV